MKAILFYSALLYCTLLHFLIFHPTQLYFALFCILYSLLSIIIHSLFSTSLSTLKSLLSTYISLRYSIITSVIFYPNVKSRSAVLYYLSYSVLYQALPVPLFILLFFILLQCILRYFIEFTFFYFAALLLLDHVILYCAMLCNAALLYSPLLFCLMLYYVFWLLYTHPRFFSYLPFYYLFCSGQLPSSLLILHGPL